VASRLRPPSHCDPDHRGDPGDGDHYESTHHNPPAPGQPDRLWLRCLPNRLVGRSEQADATSLACWTSLRVNPGGIGLV